MRAKANRPIAIATSKPITMLNTLKKCVSCLLTSLSVQEGAGTRARSIAAPPGLIRGGRAVGRPRLAAGIIARPNAPVAQLDRVAASEAAGRWFESSRARHLIK